MISIEAADETKLEPIKKRKLVRIIDLLAIEDVIGEPDRYIKESKLKDETSILHSYLNH